MCHHRWWSGRQPDSGGGEGAGRSVRVGVAPASTAAAAGGRPRSAVVWLLTAGDSPCGERNQPLQPGARAPRAAHLLFISDQLLEFGAAPVAAIVVDGHGGA